MRYNIHMKQYTVTPIAHIQTDFPEKFGLPRQSGIIDELVGKIIFEPEYRNKEALRGLENFSHIWLLWIFSENERNVFSPTVRPPRLGGNKKMGVFATRSPFRPNNIGLSSVKILSVEETDKFGTVINVSGIDLMDGTPIIDIKPYISFSDSHPESKNGFSDEVKNHSLNVDFPEELKRNLSDKTILTIEKILFQDPRPAYINDDRIYGITYADMNIKFRVKNSTAIITEIKTIN